MIGTKTLLSIAGLAGVVILGLGAETLRQAGRISTLEAQLETEKLRASTTLSACALAQEGDQAVITALRQANSQCAQARDQVAAAGRAAVEQAEVDRKAGWAAYYQLQREQESQYVEDPECGAWSALPVCAAVRDRLRAERAADPAPASGR